MSPNRFEKRDFYFSLLVSRRFTSLYSPGIFFLELTCIRFFFTFTLAHKTSMYEKKRSRNICSGRFLGWQWACTVMSIDGIADRGVNRSRLRGYTLPVHWRNSYFSRKPSSLCLSSPEESRASQNEIKPKMLSGWLVPTELVWACGLAGQHWPVPAFVCECGCKCICVCVLQAQDRWKLSLTISYAGAMPGTGNVSAW